MNVELSIFQVPITIAKFHRGTAWVTYLHVGPVRIVAWRA